jgi:transcriptional regulator of acetoin/glycerol metabolism
LPVDVPPSSERRAAPAPTRAAAVADTAAPMQVVSLEEAEQRAIAQALRECRGNMSQAAVCLKIGRATLYRKVKKYGIATDADVPVLG